MKKEIIYTTFVYSVLSFLLPISNFILLPVYTKYFTEAQFGIFSILNNINVLSSIIGGLGISMAVAAFYPTFNSDKKLIGAYIGNVLTFSLCFNACLLILFSCFGNLIFKIIFKQNIEFFPNGFLTIAYGLINNTILVFLYYVRIDKQIKQYTWLSITYFIIIVLLQYIYIVKLKKGIEGIFLARVYVSLMFLFIALLLHKKYVFTQFNYHTFILPSLKYSINIVPASLLSWVSVYGDRFFIERFIDLKWLGIYSLLSTICSLSDMIFNAIGSGLQPFVFEYYKLNDIRKINFLYRGFILVTICSISFIIFAGSNLDHFIQNKGFLAMVEFLPIMIIGFVFSAIGYLFNFQSTFAQKSSNILKTSVIVVVSNVIFTFIFIKHFGIWGAVVSSVLTKIVMSFSYVFFAQRAYYIHVYKINYVMPAIFISIILLFWLLGISNVLSFKLASFFQLITCFISMYLLNRTLIRNSYIDARQFIGNYFANPKN